MMLLAAAVLAAGGAGLFWLYQSRAQPVARSKNPEVAKRERMQGSPHDSDLRAMRSKNAHRAQFGRR